MDGISYIMSAYKTLFTELDRCDYIVDYQYTGELADYSYNDVTYEESTEAYSQKLERLYIDFLAEWDEMSDTARKAAKGMMELIVSKRYMYGGFFFDVPSSEIVDAMINDNAVPRQSVKMARFVHDMAEQQKFYLDRVAEFMGIELAKEEQCLNHIEDATEDTTDAENDNTDYDTSTENDTVTTVYQTLFKKYGSTMSVKQLSEFFQVQKRTIFDWERKGYLTNISTTSDELTASGHKKRGEEKRYLTSDIAKNIEMQRKFNRL